MLRGGNRKIGTGRRQPPERKGAEGMEKRKYKRLRYEDRQTIEAMSKRGSSVKEIADELGTHRDTIYRELKRCGATLGTYTAAAGQQAL